jgi:hypothetical protein
MLKALHRHLGIIHPPRSPSVSIRTPIIKIALHTGGVAEESIF